MRKITLSIASSFLLLVGCQGEEQKVDANQTEENFLIQQPALKEMIKAAHGSMPDIQLKDGTPNGDWNAEMKSKAIQHSDNVLSTLELVEELDDAEKVVNGYFVSAKYKEGFEYFVLTDQKEPHHAIYIRTKEDKTYKAKGSADAVEALIQWMHTL